MKTAFQGDNVDYSSFFSQSLDPLTWNLNNDTSNMDVGTSSISPSNSPPSSATPSPSATVNSSSAHQEVSLQIPTTLQVSSMSTSVSPMPLSSFAVTGNIQKSSSPLRSKLSSPPTKAGYRAPIVKPSPAEEELVQRIHRKVGGPAKLSTYDDPAKVRQVVIEALANEQEHFTEASRVRKGQLTVFERRVVRTVTNRGAAVRSRMRQRKEMAHLKQQLRLRDVRVQELETVVRSLCSAYAVPLPPSVPPERAQSSLRVPSNPDAMVAPMPSSDMGAIHGDAIQREAIDNIGRDAMSMGVPTANTHELGFQQPMFSCLSENGVTHLPWS